MSDDTSRPARENETTEGHVKGAEDAADRGLLSRRQAAEACRPHLDDILELFEPGAKIMLVVWGSERDFTMGTKGGIGGAIEVLERKRRGRRNLLREPKGDV